MMFTISCHLSNLSEFDAFPTYLKYAEASVSLKSLLASEEVDSSLKIIRIEQLNSRIDGKTYVLVFLKDSTKERLIILDEALSIVRIEKNTAFGSFLGVDVKGRYLCGSTSFTSESAYASGDAGLATAIKQYGNYERLASIGGNGYNALLGINGSTIRLLDFTTAQAWTPYTDYSATISNTSGYAFLDVLRGDGQSDVVRVLLSRDDRIIVANFADYSALRTAINAAKTSNFVSRSSTVTGPFYDGSGAWITRDGVVVTNGGDRQLIRYPFADLTAEDTIEIGEDYENAFISVDEKGDRWFLFDYESSWLYALRTWW
jgi:hypothetical protein